MSKKLKLIILFFITISLVFTLSDSEFKKLREKMVKYQIEYRGIEDKNVLKSMRKVPRHLFVPENNRKNAYRDRPLAIGYGQTISQPYIVALMTELLDVNAKSKVLEIGTGSGYQAAILSQIVKEVYTIEIYKELSIQAEKRFKMLEYNNIETLNADGYYGHEENAPYDAIIVTCAPTFVPPPLIKQLKIGGILVIPVGPP
ncbi:MAG: protein-L-isoaspartate(D-aspartate) O-methyltransferase, partial [Spirochaetes bacterium]|nr:protein-L-isoaspartate(D-aspartate) O-methyltransferase [Spirochaetota bacterium]